MPNAGVVLSSCPGGPMLVITDDSTRADLEQAMTHMRAKQLQAVIPSTARECADECDRLLEAWTKAPA